MLHTPLKKSELMDIAKMIDLKGRSKMSKEELYQAIFGKGRKKQISPKNRLSPYVSPKIEKYGISDSKIEELGKELEIIFKYKTKNSRVKQIADELAKRMCDCIKKITKTNKRVDESRAIAICRSSVLKKRGVDLYTFKCKDEDGNYSPTASPKKGTKNVLRKSLN